jgi:hypothetical protein
VTEAGLPELDMARVRRWCQQRVPEHAHSQVAVECDVTPRHVTIVECRPPGFAPVWMRIEMIGIAVLMAVVIGFVIRERS